MGTLTKRNYTTFPSLFNNSFFDDDFFNFDNFSLTPRFSMNTPKFLTEQTDENLFLKVALPGYTKDDVDISLTNNVLSVKTEKSTEFGYSAFQKSFTVPNSLTEKDISAEFKDGILQITLKNVKPVETTKRIEIK